MQPNNNETDRRNADVARTLILLNNYEWVKKEAADIGVTIIPIKGIDLLQTLYSEKFDRFVRDIDVLCLNRSECVKLAERLCKNGYRLEFPYSLHTQILETKKKVSLLSGRPTKVNVDLHTSLVTKKFFSQTVGTFNQDALSRCVDGHLERTDNWLFLAQHAAFHLFSDVKWIRDLHLLYRDFTPGEQDLLKQKARHYGFNRVTMLTLHLLRHLGEEQKTPPPPTYISSSDKRFLSFAMRFINRPAKGLSFRVSVVYWEFLFISRRVERFRSWLRLLFPSIGMLGCIYRMDKTCYAPFFYLLNFPVVLLSSVVFGFLYYLVPRKT